ncbi:uncharacterized protein DS421_12g369700 [Arachis hypogaea]|nr:uncharacterized protein DS421_12g369700 [Arachis hypogaea]
MGVAGGLVYQGCSVGGREFFHCDYGKKKKKKNQGCSDGAKNASIVTLGRKRRRRMACVLYI